MSTPRYADGVEYLVQAMLGDPEIGEAAAKFARDTLKEWGVNCPELGTDELSEFEPFWFLLASYHGTLANSLGQQVGLQISSRGILAEHLWSPLNLPKVPDLPIETVELVDEILESLTQKQLRDVMRTMMTDPCNQINMDNWAHYFA